MQKRKDQLAQHRAVESPQGALSPFALKAYLIAIKQHQARPSSSIVDMRHVQPIGVSCTARTRWLQDIGGPARRAKWLDVKSPEGAEQSGVTHKILVLYNI